METRKLQQVGGGTFTVSIPKAWADEHGLEAGASVHLYTHSDGSVILRSSAEDRGALDHVALRVVDRSPERLARMLRSAHGNGFERVTVSADQPFTDDQRRAARSACRELVGLEIESVTETGMVLRTLLAAEDVSIRQSLVRFQFLTVSVHRQVVGAARDGGGLEADRAAEADRLYQMISRHFSRAQLSIGEVDRLGVARSSLFDYYRTASALRALTELGISMVRTLEALEQPAGVADEIERVAERTPATIESAVNAVIEGTSVDAACDVLDACDRRSEELAALESAIDGADGAQVEAGFDSSTAIRQVVQELRRTNRRTKRIGDIALSAATRSRSG